MLYDRYEYLGCLPYEVSASTFHFFSFVSTVILDQIQDRELIQKVLKMTAIDLKMQQTDRHDQNVLCQIDKKGISDLSKLFDFGESYTANCFFDFNYDNPFLIVRRTRKSLDLLCEHYPGFFPFLEKMSSIELGDILHKIEKEKGIILTGEEMNWYTKKDEKSNKLLQLK